MTTKPRTTWQPGQSGNPRGRPKGAGEVARLRAAIGENIPAVLEVLTEKALAGDVASARPPLERALPAVKPVELAQAIAMPTEGTLTDQGRAVLSAVASGELSATQGAQLVTAIGQLARLAEIDELEKRIAALEKKPT